MGHGPFLPVLIVRSTPTQIPYDLRSWEGPPEGLPDEPNEAESTKMKDAGNDFYRRKKYLEAIACYSKVGPIDLIPRIEIQPRIVITSIS